MERAVVQFGAPRCVKRVGRRIYTNGWWREGEHPNVVVNTETASYFDFRDSDGGGVSQFARVAFGLRLPEFMERFGAVSAMEPTRPAPVERGPVGEGVGAVWDALELGGSERSAAWLRGARGIEPAACVSGFADLNPSVIEDQAIREFTSRVLLPAIVLPLRDARGVPRSLHLRPHGRGGRRFLPGPLTTADGPLGYGMVHQALGADVLVVVEGAVDTLAAEAMMSSEPDAVVIGMASSSMARAWAAFLRKKQRGSIVVVPHLDPPPHVGQKAAASIVASLRSCDIPAGFFDWDSFRGRSSASDVAEAAMTIGFQTARRRFVDAVSRGLP